MAKVRHWKATKASYTFREAADHLGYSSTDAVYELLSSGALVSTEVKSGGRGLRILGTSLEDHINGNIVHPEGYQAKAEDLAKSNTRR